LTLRVGVIGCGYWGPRLVRNFVSILNEGMRAVADTDQRRLDVITEQYPFIRTATDPMELIESRDIDAIAIATPAHTHFDLAQATIAAGKHVLIEKPMTDSVQSSVRLIDLAEQAKVVLMVDHTFIYTGAVRKMKEIVNSGELGELYYFDSVRVNLGLFQHDVNVLWDLAPHDVSIMDDIIGKSPIAVAAHGVAHMNYGQNKMEDIAYLTVYYPDNLIGHIHVNWLAPVKIRRTLIGGSKKMIMYDDTEPAEKVKVYDRGVELSGYDDPTNLYKALVSYRMGDMYAPHLEQVEALRREVEHFVDCIETGAKPETDGYAGLNVVRILDAASRSLRNGGATTPIDHSGMDVTVDSS
jgi:predicted dehydrogenase